jgi:hypothetical protein
MYFNDHRRSQRITLAKSSESSLRMIPASFGIWNHAAAINLNAASVPGACPFPAEAEDICSVSAFPAVTRCRRHEPSASVGAAEAIPEPAPSLILP